MRASHSGGPPFFEFSPTQTCRTEAGIADKQQQKESLKAGGARPIVMEDTTQKPTGEGLQEGLPRFL
jgi:hypothetical protein